MERLTTNKPVDEMSMLELAYNSCYAENGKAMCRNFETVKDARNFARDLYKAYLGEELPNNDEYFDADILDDLQYDAVVHLRGLIALFYRNLWAMADMRERLKTYEDKQEQGLLLELPVPLGTEVYKVVEDKTAATIETIKYNGHEYHRTIPCYFVCRDLFTFSMIKEVGKTVFLTLAEARQAEEALTKMGGK